MAVPPRKLDMGQMEPKPPPPWEEMRKESWEKLVKTGADINFIRFLFENFTSPIDFSAQPIDKKTRETFLRRTKRRIHKQHDGNSRDMYWKMVRQSIKAAYKIKYKKTPFGFIPIIKNHKTLRPMPLGLLRIIFALKIYFKKITGNPCWDLMADLIAPMRVYVGTDLASYWRKRKDFIEGWNEDRILYDLEYMYKHFSGGNINEHAYPFDITREKGGKK